MRFADKTVLVTGSGRGIGARTARRFAREGARVVIADVDGEAAERLADSIGEALAIEVDVSSRESVHRMVRTVTDRLGGIDVLVNNAATCCETPFLEMTAEEVQQDIAIGLMGPFFASQEVIPGMIQRGGGTILNVGSINGMAYFGNEAYSAAKAGLLSLTRSIAVQFGPDGVRCNAVAPGTIETEFWEGRKRADPTVLDDVTRWYPLGRVGQPDDVADALLFLASDAAAWITGIVLPVEGGILAGNAILTREIHPRQEPTP